MKISAYICYRTPKRRILTLKEYSKKTGLNSLKIYNYAKYKGKCNNHYRDMVFKELPFCFQSSVRQVLVNLKCIYDGKTNMPISESLMRSGFKVTGKYFALNIMDGFNVNNKGRIDVFLTIDHVKKLIEETEKFIK